jgi:hypothetical protein
MRIVPDVVTVDAQLCLQFLGRDAIMMLPSVVASDPAHWHDANLNAPPVEALKFSAGQVRSGLLLGRSLGP